MEGILEWKPSVYMLTPLFDSNKNHDNFRAKNKQYSVKEWKKKKSQF